MWFEFFEFRIDLGNESGRFFGRSGEEGEVVVVCLNLIVDVLVRRKEFFGLRIKVGLVGDG